MVAVSSGLLECDKPSARARRPWARAMASGRRQPAGSAGESFAWRRGLNGRLALLSVLPISLPSPPGKRIQANQGSGVPRNFLGLVVGRGSENVNGPVDGRGRIQGGKFPDRIPSAARGERDQPPAQPYCRLAARLGLSLLLIQILDQDMPRVFTPVWCHESVSFESNECKSSRVAGPVALRPRPAQQFRRMYGPSMLAVLPVELSVLLIVWATV
jgi:hypothetical protein